MSTDYEMAWQDADDYCKDVSENSALVEILSVEVTFNYNSQLIAAFINISANGLPWNTSKNIGDPGKGRLHLIHLH